MINTSRPIDVFSFYLDKDYLINEKPFIAGQTQLKRGEPSADGTPSHKIYVYHGSDFYRKPYMIVGDKTVREVMNLLKTRHIDAGEYGDYGNENQTD